jgi:hypothetical protein
VVRAIPAGHELGPGLERVSGRWREQGVSFDEDPVEAVLDAIERGSDLFIAYAGAEGMTERHITPQQIEGAAVRPYCRLRRTGTSARSGWHRFAPRCRLVTSLPVGVPSGHVVAGASPPVAS